MVTYILRPLPINPQFLGLQTRTSLLLQLADSRAQDLSASTTNSYYIHNIKSPIGPVPLENPLLFNTEPPLSTDRDIVTKCGAPTAC